MNEGRTLLNNKWETTINTKRDNDKTRRERPMTTKTKQNARREHIQELRKVSWDREFKHIVGDIV